MTNAEVQKKLKDAGLTHATDGILMTATGRAETSQATVLKDIHNSIIRREYEIEELTSIYNDLEADLEEENGN